MYPVSPIADAKAWAVVIDLPKQVLLADSVKLQAVLDDAQQSGTIKALSVAVIAGLIGLLLVWLMASSVTRPILGVAHMLEDIASGEGDLTRRLAYDKKDELGQLAGWFNRFLDKLQPIIAEVKRSVQDARSTADQSSAIATPDQRRHGAAIPPGRSGRHRVPRNERHRPGRRPQRRARGQRRQGCRSGDPSTA